MYVASQNGHKDVVDILVKRGANIHLATIEVHVSILTCTKFVKHGESGLDTTSVLFEGTDNASTI